MHRDGAVVPVPLLTLVLEWRRAASSRGGQPDSGSGVTLCLRRTVRIGGDTGHDRRQIEAWIRLRTAAWIRADLPLWWTVAISVLTLLRGRCSMEGARLSATSQRTRSDILKCSWRYEKGSDLEVPVLQI